MHPDEARWNEKYRNGSHQEPEQPPALLLELLPTLERGRALDLACGRGRNALWLAQEGFRVQAVDLSGVALEQLRARADARERNARGLELALYQLDLDTWEPARVWGVGAPAWTLITCTRYLDRRLLSLLPTLLAPGGYLLYEALISLETPSPSAFRIHPEALWAAFERPGLRRVARALSDDGQALAVLVQREP
ncbi:MAG: class I SAM-dependent methyltransferase [Myxococcota bacterium]